MTRLCCQVDRQFPITALQVHIRAVEKQDANHDHIAILRGGVQGRKPSLLADVRIGPILEQQRHNAGMACSRGGLDGSCLEGISGWGVDPCAGFDQILCSFIMTEEARQTQGLESVIGIFIHKLRVVCHEAGDLEGFTSSSRLKYCQTYRFFSKKICYGRLLMVGRNKDRAETILPLMDQTRGYQQQALDRLQVSGFYSIEEFTAHLNSGISSLFSTCFTAESDHV